MFEDLTPIKKKEIMDILLYSNKTELEIKKIFNVLLFQVFLDYSEKKSTIIPNIGKIKLKHIRDEVVREQGKDRKKAILDIEFEADPKLEKLIGQVSDGVETYIEKYIKNKIKNVLESKLEE